MIELNEMKKITEQFIKSADNFVKTYNKRTNTPTKLKLEKFDDNFEDYWDSEKECYIVYANGDIPNIAIDVLIIDYNNVDWHCYLSKVEYIANQNTYELQYKCY